MDTKTCEVLRQLDLDSVVLISLDEFLDPQLTQIQKERSTGEFCWTCTPFLLDFVIGKGLFQRVIYLDADTYFFSNPSEILDLWPLDKPLMLSRHRYHKDYDQSEQSGIYCVQFNGFDTTEPGRRALYWWKEKCAEWCYSRVEPMRFGDQKYLDYIETECQVSAFIPNHPGEGMAPWNSRDTKISLSGKALMVTDLSTKPVPVVYYHFHGLKLFTGSFVDLCLYYYVLPQSLLDLMYRPYVNHLVQICTQYGWMTGYDWLVDSSEHIKRTEKRQQMGTYYRFSINDFLKVG